MLAPLFDRSEGCIPIAMKVSLSTNGSNVAGHLKRRPRLLPKPARNPGFLLEMPKGREGWLVARRARAVRRGVAVLAWTLPAMPIQAILIMLPGRLKIAFPRLYWSVFTRLMGIKVRVVGNPASGAAGRRVVFVSNHSSWVDVPVVGGVLHACFVAKIDVADWPLVSTIARLGRTVYVSRSRISTARERDAMRCKLALGDNLILFPEGTSSDGSRVLPFRTSFFALAETRAGESLRTCRSFSRFRWSMTDWAVCP